MLNESEDRGLRIAVLARTGQLKAFDCSMCPDELREARNCFCDDDFDDSVVYLPTIGELGVCPLRLIPDTIIQFLNKIDYIDRFPGSYRTPFEDCNPKFWEAVKLYDTLIAEYRESERERISASNK